jgi:hypothetical protein
MCRGRRLVALRSEGPPLDIFAWQRLLWVCNQNRETHDGLPIRCAVGKSQPG